MHHPAKDAGKKIVVIVGGGFAGLNAAKTLAGNPAVFVVLVDQRNHHLFQPLLYQVATAGLNPGDIAVPIRAQFPNVDNVEVHWDKAMAVNLEKKKIQFRENELEYDFLILACGAQHSYFGRNDWEKVAPGLKTLEQATEIRRRILSAFENAENELDVEKQKSFLNFVVVGGGPTGVELAGAIADISRTVLVGDFKRINPSSARIILIEAGNKILASFADDLAHRSVEDLTQMGVEVKTGSRVTAINEDGVQVGEQFIAAKTVIWAAGVEAAKMDFTPALNLDRAGRVPVSADLSVASFPDTFVVGDMAAVEIEKEKFVPGLAPAAIQEGKHAAEIILASIKNQPRKIFIYHDKGQMATIGKHKAIVQLGKLHMTGYPAWLSWLFVHIFYLIGFRNRVLVLSEWAWNYLFSKRGSRLIVEKQWQIKS